ncbi:MAG: hypothetical protein K0U66_06275 [Gammaproteobacteria bacterium]|nr:hypothetical protein [Gammaproteobacteria bacterium]
MRIEQSLKRMRARSRMLRAAREFFIRRGFLEVQTPCLGAYPPNETHLQPFRAYPTTTDATDATSASTSTESASTSTESASTSPASDGGPASASTSTMSATASNAGATISNANAGTSPTSATASTKSTSTSPTSDGSPANATTSPANATTSPTSATASTMGASASSAAGGQGAGGDVGGGGDQRRERSRWLHASPESAMKRLLARTEQDIFQICPVFRAFESGPHHLEEFTMLEWYRTGYTWEQLLSETVDLLRKCRLSFSRLNQMTWLEWTEAHYGCNLFSLRTEQLAEMAEKYQLSPTQDREVMIEFLFERTLAFAKGDNELFVISHYPAQWAVNARIGADPLWCSRFEIFYQGLELVNGCEEITDSTEQAERFAARNRRRRQLGQTELELDALWMADCAHMPKCAGAALGIDRLLMATGKFNSISLIDPLNLPLAPN